MIPGWLISLAVKLVLSFLESKATSILKKDAPSVVSRLNAVAANVQTFHSDADFPPQIKATGV